MIQPRCDSSGALEIRRYTQINQLQIYIFAVNHGRPGDTIVIFSHKIGTDSVQVVKSVKHPNIKTANGVAAAGPL